MENRSVTHSTFVIERSYPASPERVFAAFADPAVKSQWFVHDRGLEVLDHAMDFRAGGVERARYRLKEGAPFPGATLANDTVYQDIVPNRRIVIAYTMSLGDKRFSASLATFEFQPDKQGTNLIFTEQGAYFEGADGPQIREEGWSRLLDKLRQQFPVGVPA